MAQVFRRRWPGLSYGRGEDWHYVGEAGEPAFENGWTAVGGGYFAFRIRESGVVDMQGAVENGTKGTTIFTLPSGYRPSSSAYVTGITAFVVTGSVVVPAALLIATDGKVTATGVVIDNPDWVRVSGQFFLSPPIP